MASRNVTISEALATIKLIPKRVEKQTDAMRDYLIRQRMVTDPLGENGSPAFVAARRQSVNDLLDDLVKMRTTVLSKSLSTDLTISGITHTIQGWIIWRREAVPLLGFMHKWLANAIHSANEGAKKTRTVVSDNIQEGEREDMLVNFDQLAYHREVEALEMTLSQIDAALSRINATVEITVPDGPFVLA